MLIVPDLSFPTGSTINQEGHPVRLLGTTSSSLHRFFFLHGRSLLGRCPWSGLARQSVHSTEKLVCNAASFPESTKQSTVNSRWVVANRMFSRKEQTRNWLEEKGKMAMVTTVLMSQASLCILAPFLGERLIS